MSPKPQNPKTPKPQDKRESNEQQKIKIKTNVDCIGVNCDQLPADPFVGLLEPFGPNPELMLPCPLDLPVSVLARTAFGFWM